MFVQMESGYKKSEKADPEITEILSQIERILKNSAAGTGFALHLVTAPAKDVLSLVSGMRKLTPSLEDIQKEVPNAQEWKVIFTPKLAFTGDKQMSVPPGK